MGNKKGMAILLIVGIVLFSGVGVIALSHIPDREALKIKLTNACIANGGDQVSCKAKYDQMTQKEREALNK